MDQHLVERRVGRRVICSSLLTTIAVLLALFCGIAIANKDMRLAFVTGSVATICWIASIVLMSTIGIVVRQHECPPPTS